MSDTSKYIISELTIPPSKKEHMSEAVKYVNPLIWVDSEVLPGAFQFFVGWIPVDHGPTPEDDVNHMHDSDEILGFCGSDPEHPEDLCGEVEIWLDGEQHIFTKSTVVFIPAGMKHNPMTINRADRPIIHFSAAPTKIFEAHH